MQVGWLRILSVLFAALAMVFSGAHLLELSHKIGLSAADYLTVQQLYRGWQFAGAASQRTRHPSSRRPRLR